MKDASSSWWHWPLRCLVATALAATMARRGRRRAALSASGAAAAFAVGALTMQASWIGGLLLILFYLSGSKVTRLAAGTKARLEADYSADGGARRSAVQVLSNSAGGVAAALAAQWAALASGGSMSGVADRSAAAAAATAAARWRFVATAALVAHYAACAADTFASEVGVLSTARPRLVTTLRRVPTGTNGAVSALGSFAGAAGGLMIGGAFWALAAALGGAEPALLALPPPGVLAGSRLERVLAGTAGGAPALLLLWLLVGLATGVLGSLVDSLLGATLQFSGVDSRGRATGRPGPGVRRVAGRDFLSNDAVNALAAATAALGAAAVAQWLLGPAAV